MILHHCVSWVMCGEFIMKGLLKTKKVAEESDISWVTSKGVITSFSPTHWATVNGCHGNLSSAETWVGWFFLLLLFQNRCPYVFWTIRQIKVISIMMETTAKKSNESLKTNQKGYFKWSNSDFFFLQKTRSLSCYIGKNNFKDHRLSLKWIIRHCKWWGIKSKSGICW